MRKLFLLFVFLSITTLCEAQQLISQAYEGPAKHELGVVVGVFTSAWADMPTGLFNERRILDATAGLHYRRLFYSSLSWEAGLHYQRSHYYVDRGRPQHSSGYLRQQDLTYLAVPLRLNYQTEGKTGINFGFGTQIQAMLQGRQEFLALGLQNQIIEVNSTWRESRLEITPWIHTGFNHQINTLSNLRFECSWNLMSLGLGESFSPLIQLALFSKLP